MYFFMCYLGTVFTTKQAVMPSNVEIKARVHDFVELVKRAKELSGSDGEVLEQEDTFFVCPKGRLKLRLLKVTTSFKN